ncbi:sensor histidine kinase [Pseudophaeobacter leonis]|uniref:sensor histidine kinase n=1 Tax=Pseudophaeobacter leonis TaxID=1144477 RepID=UPI0009F38BF9|nr:ATP-binding protein [Pseudophaeobacter leonis]
MLGLLSKLTTRWRTSVVFKLSVATSAIVLLVAMLQLIVGTQIIRLNGAQASILTDSIPLLDKAQKFSKLTALTVSETKLLEEHLTKTELDKLRIRYLKNDAEAQVIFFDILSLDRDRLDTALFQYIRDEFVAANEALFQNQFTQRDLEREVQEYSAYLLSLTSSFEDIIDQLLIVSSTEVLSRSADLGATSGLVQKELDMFLVFAREVEVLNSLKSGAVDFSNMIQGRFGQLSQHDVSALADRLNFRLKSTSLSLTLLGNSEARAKLAQLASELSKGLFSDPGYLYFLRELQASREDVETLKRHRDATVSDIGDQVQLIMQEATGSFRADIALTSRLTQNIKLIGIATTVVVLAVLVLLNGQVINKQISQRFTLLTEDVLNFARGNYAHEIRVSGEDELGDIANALNVFKEQAAELERSNAELQRFAYVAAHDLRSPLDAIQDLATWTLEDERDDLSAACIANLELLIKRSARLSALQADLLTYAQVGQIDTTIGPISLSEEVNKMSDMLDPGGDFQITLLNDPGTVVTYSLPLRQILLNLLTNAIKHHDLPTGKIVVTFSRSPGVLRFAVEDDGPGIEPRFQKRIFGLFKTLKSRDRVEGSGLGLAFVLKLTSRLGGKIEVESHAPEQRGTRFIFEIADLCENDKVSDVA